MSSSITLSAATRQNLLSLQDTASLAATNQGRLATGKKVNSALDNPVNYFTAQSLSARSSALSGLLDGIAGGIQTIQAASKGIGTVTSLVKQLQSVVTQAQSNAAQNLPKIAGSATNGLASATEAAAAGKSQHDAALGKTVLGTQAAAGGTSSGNLGVTANQMQIKAGNSVYTFTIGASDTLSDVVNAINKSGLATASVDSNGQLNVVGTGSDPISVSLGSSSGTSGTGTSGTGTSGTGTSGTGTSGTGTSGTGTSGTGTSGTGTSGTGTSGTGTSGTGTSGTGTSGTGTSGTGTSGTGTSGTGTSGTGTSGTGTSGTGTSGTSGTGTTAAGSASGDFVASASDTALLFGAGTATSNVSGGGTSAQRSALVSQFNTLLTQINQAAQDSGFNGVNLLNGDMLTVAFNEKTGTAQSKLNVQSDALTAGSLGLGQMQDSATASTGSGFSIQNNADLAKASSALTNALTTLQSQSSTLGSNLSVVQTRQDFTKGMINVLDTGASNLTDADMNEEAANSQALQTRQSLGISALSLANQAQQSVLQLLR